MGTRLHIFDRDLHTCHFSQIRLGKEIAGVEYQGYHAQSDSLPSCLLLGAAKWEISPVDSQPGAQGEYTE